MRPQKPLPQANPVRPSPSEPGWALVLVGVFVVVATVGGVAL